MKSKVNISNEDEKKFPRLLKGKKSGHVVFFKSKHTGIVVHQGKSDKELGHLSTCWANCDDSETWEPLPKGSTVTLEQE